MNIFTRKISTLLFFAALSLSAVAQDNMGIGTLTPHPSSILDLTADDKGFLAPRLTTAQRDAARQQIEASRKVVRDAAKKYNSKDLQNMSLNFFV